MKGTSKPGIMYECIFVNLRNYLINILVYFIALVKKTQYFLVFKYKNVQWTASDIFNLNISKYAKSITLKIELETNE